jgi:ligand-binding sensor domain-containing protein
MDWNGWRRACEDLMELIGLFITHQILNCLSNWVYAIAIDASGNKWIGTEPGLERINLCWWRAFKI